MTAAEEQSELELLAGRPLAARDALINLLANVQDRGDVPFLARARTILIEIDIAVASDGRSPQVL